VASWRGPAATVVLLLLVLFSGSARAAGSVLRLSGGSQVSHPGSPRGDSPGSGAPRAAVQVRLKAVSSDKWESEDETSTQSSETADVPDSAAAQSGAGASSTEEIAQEGGSGGAKPHPPRLQRTPPVEQPVKRDPAPIAAVPRKRSAAQSGFGGISSSDDDSSTGSGSAPGAASLGAIAAGERLPKRSRRETKRVEDARRTTQQEEEAQYCDVRSNRCKDYAETGSCPYGDRCIYAHDRSEFVRTWYRKAKAKLAEEKVEERRAAAEALLIPPNCPLCEGEYREPVRTGCGHFFCSACIMPRFENGQPGGQECPLCAQKLSGAFAIASDLPDRLRAQFDAPLPGQVLEDESEPSANQKEYETALTYLGVGLD